MILDLLFGAGASLAVFYALWPVADRVGDRQSLVKTGAVGFLALYALLAGGDWMLVGALAASALGDYFLSREGDRAFLAGMAAFFVGHVAYIALFVVAAPNLPIAWGATGILGLFSFALMGRLWPGLGSFRLPVLAYGAAIFLMGAAVFRLPLETFWMAHLGAVLFILSDSVLALAKFRPPKARALQMLAPHVVWLTYWPAQALLMFAMLP